mmetsp:Transcript_3343/g.8431  ORF Transcript_3343/g.8431 Transcript_3343/m.8431 type:complete len:344 (-) Transcript_3343:576-1607(-)
MPARPHASKADQLGWLQVPHQRRQTLVLDPKLLKQGNRALCRPFGCTPIGRFSLDGADHEVLGGVLPRDVFKDGRLVAGRLQQAGPQRIGEQLCLALCQDAVTEHILQRCAHRRHPRAGAAFVQGCLLLPQLSAELFVAAGRGEDDGGAALHAVEKGVVRGGVAGVQRDEDVHGACSPGARLPRPHALLPRPLRDGALPEGEPREAVQLRGGPVAGRHQVLANLHPRGDHLPGGRAAQAREEGVRGKGEVALAGAHVHHAQLRGAHHRRALHGVPQNLAESIHLAQLAGHAGARLPGGICEQQRCAVMASTGTARGSCVGQDTREAYCAAMRRVERQSQVRYG